MNCLSTSFKYVQRCSSFTLIKNLYMSNVGNEFIQFNNKFNIKNKYFLHTTASMMAGHSKWSNIKAIKGSKDLEKSQIFNKYIQFIKIACKEGGGTNPKLNSKLAKVIEQSRVHNMPQATIENALKKIEKSAENSKPASLTFASPSKLFIAVDVFTSNVNRTRNDLRSITKKLNFKDMKGNLESIFEEKGYVVTKPKDFNKAVDDAIEAGAEDVTEDDGLYTFVCDPNDFPKVRYNLENKNYDIEYASVDKIPHVLVPVKEEEADKLKFVLSRLEEHDEVVKLHCNFEV